MEARKLISLLKNSRTTDSRVAAKSAGFLFGLVPRPAACAAHLSAHNGHQTACALVIAAVAMCATSWPLAAHHAFGSEFDANRPVILKGKIVKIEWINPHTWIHVEVTKVDGTKEVWMCEGGSPNTLLRRGANKNTFPEGTDVIIDGYQARDHTELRANARNVTFPDGRKLFLGSTGTGAPNPDDFPVEKARKEGK